MMRSFRRPLAGALFLASYLLPAADDLKNFLWYQGWASTHLFRSAQREVPHFTFHAVTPLITLSLVTVIFSGAIVLGPYRRGEVWATWILAAAGLTDTAVKSWGSIVFYPHWESGVAAPLLLLFAALGVTWADRQAKRSSDPPRVSTISK